MSAQISESEAFAAVVAAWDEPCEQPVADCNRCELRIGGVVCGHGAEWSIDAHGCARVLVCSDHLTLWERLVLTLRIDRGRIVCKKCGRRFSSLSDARSVVPT